MPGVRWLPLRGRGISQRMRYIILIMPLAIALGCAVQRPQLTERKDISTTPSPTPTPLSDAVASADLYRGAKNELPREAKRILDRAEKLELILIEPSGGRYHPNIEYKLNSQDRYYGYEVLGKAVVSGARAKELRRALYSGVAAIRAGESAMCFSPRHGLRATHKGRTTELLICFQCMNLSTYTADGQRHPPMTAIARGAQPVFNRLLSEGGVSVE